MALAGQVPKIGGGWLHGGGAKWFNKHIYLKMYIVLVIVGNLDIYAMHNMVAKRKE